MKNKLEVGQKLYMAGTEPGRRSAIDGCVEVTVTYVGRIYFNVSRFRESHGPRDPRFRVNGWAYAPQGTRGITQLRLYPTQEEYEAEVTENMTRQRLETYCRRGTSFGWREGIWHKLPLDAVEDILKILDDKLPKENS